MHHSPHDRQIRRVCRRVRVRRNLFGCRPCASSRCRQPAAPRPVRDPRRRRRLQRHGRYRRNLPQRLCACHWDGGGDCRTRLVDSTVGRRPLATRFALGRTKVRVAPPLGRVMRQLPGAYLSATGVLCPLGTNAQWPDLCYCGGLLGLGHGNRSGVEYLGRANRAAAAAGRLLRPADSHQSGGGTRRLCGRRLQPASRRGVGRTAVGVRAIVLDRGSLPFDLGCLSSEPERVVRLRQRHSATCRRGSFWLA